MDFDVTAEVAALKKQTQARRKVTYQHQKSRLDKFADELLQLYHGGCSVAELQRWLRANRIRVVHSTVARWIAKHG